MSRDQLEQRLAEVNERIARATAWGALLTALSEERKNIEQELRFITARDNQKA